jgi:hypothetical protein
VDDDPVIATATFNDSQRHLHHPGAHHGGLRLDPDAGAAAPPPSTIDWVGKMWPRGGVASASTRARSAPSGFDVYVRVYDAGVTEPGGAPAGIACTLHWGRYGQPWSDLAMSWHVQNGNDDEFKASIPQATLNATDPGHIRLQRLLPAGRRGEEVEDRRSMTSRATRWKTTRATA